MKRILLTAVFLGLAATAAGCTHGHVSVSARTHVARPNLVYLGPGIWVVGDYHEPVFYSDGSYWLYRGGLWYRSSVHYSGWIRVRSYGVPVAVRRIDRPNVYVRYRGPAHRVRTARPATYRRDHRQPTRARSEARYRTDARSRKKPERVRVRDHR